MFDVQSKSNILKGICLLRYYRYRIFHESISNIILLLLLLRSPHLDFSFAFRYRGLCAMGKLNRLLDYFDSHRNIGVSPQYPFIPTELIAEAQSSES